VITDADDVEGSPIVSNTITLTVGESAVCEITNNDVSIDGFEVGNDGINYAVNPSTFTATGDDLFVKITDTTSVDFTNLKKVEAELKDADRNRIKVILSDFVINGNTASAIMSGLGSTFTDGEVVKFKIKAEDNDRNKVEFQIDMTIDFP
jgi:hypothetical protein